MQDQVPGGDYGCAGRLGHGLGFYVVREGGCADLPGLGPGTIRHDGRFSTDFWYDPGRDRIGIFLYQIVTNGNSTPSLAESDAFKQMLARMTAEAGRPCPCRMAPQKHGDRVDRNGRTEQ
jgi:hypothetical protein